MDEPTTARPAAEAAAEAVRTLNHLTMRAPAVGVAGWEDLADVYAVVGELQVLAQRLPQAIDQLGRVFDEPRVDYGADSDEDPVDVIIAARAALLGAGGEAAALHRSLERAQRAISHLYVERNLAVVDDPGWE